MIWPCKSQSTFSRCWNTVSRALCRNLGLLLCSVDYLSTSEPVGWYGGITASPGYKELVNHIPRALPAPPTFLLSFYLWFIFKTHLRDKRREDVLGEQGRWSILALLQGHGWEIGVCRHPIQSNLLKQPQLRKENNSNLQRCTPRLWLENMTAVNEESTPV